MKLFTHRGGPADPVPVFHAHGDCLHRLWYTTIMWWWCVRTSYTISFSPSPSLHQTECTRVTGGLCCCCPQVQVKEQCDWWEGPVNMRGLWRSTTMVPGGLCVMMAGICRMPQWCVINWAMAQLWVHLGVLLFD